MSALDCIPWNIMNFSFRIFHNLSLERTRRGMANWVVRCREMSGVEPQLQLATATVTGHTATRPHMGPFRGERTLIPSKIALSYVNYFWYLLILWNCVFIDFHWCWLYLNIYIYYISYQIHPKPFSSFPNTGLKPAVRAVVSTKANTTPSEPPSGVVATEPVLRKTWKTQSWTSSERIWWLSYHCLIIVLSVNLCQLMSLFSLVLCDTDVYWCCMLLHIEPLYIRVYIYAIMYTVCLSYVLCCNYNTIVGYHMLQDFTSI